MAKLRYRKAWVSFSLIHRKFSDTTQWSIISSHREGSFAHCANIGLEVATSGEAKFSSSFTPLGSCHNMMSNRSSWKGRNLFANRISTYALEILVGGP